MLSLNRVILVGQVATVLDCTPKPNRLPAVRFKLSTTEFVGEGDGPKKRKMNWHRIVVLNPAYCAMIVQAAVRIGAVLLVEGTLENRKFTDSAGVKREVVEIVLGQSDSRLLVFDDGNAR